MTHVEELERENAELRAKLAAHASAERRALDRLLADRTVLANLPDLVAVVDREFRMLYINRTQPQYTIEQTLGSSALDYVVPESREAFARAIEQVWATGEPNKVSVATHEDYWWESRLVPVKEGDVMEAVLITSADVTERRRAERALRESELRLRMVLAATHVGTWTWDRASGAIQQDETLCAICGFAPNKAPRTAEEYLEFIHPEDRSRMAEVIRHFAETGRTENTEHRVVRPDGSVRHVLGMGMLLRDGAGNIITYQGIVMDITERKELEEQLRHVQKMEAIGQLTAGIAHNFNNVLGIILPNLALCQAKASPDIRERLDDIQHAAESAAEMVRQLMLFARRDGTVKKEPLDLVSTTRRIIDMCRATLGRQVTVDFSAAPQLPAVLGNAWQLEQVILNLCLNARDALLRVQQRRRPRIEVRLDRYDGKQVRLTVSDNGIGMDEATRKRVFEPFFTTKEVGRGTGLGLASAHAIITDHGGTIRCESVPNEGTTFIIDLPATEATVPPPNAEALPPTSAPAPSSGL